MLLGLARLAQADNAGARAALERAAAIAPQRADIAHNLGTVYLEQKDLTRAAAAFRRVTELDPNAVEAREVLAKIETQIAAQAPPPTPDSRRAPARAVGARLTAVDYKPLGIRGLLVEEVVAGGAAARAGLAVGDLVLRADGRPVENVESLERAVRDGGRSVELAVLRQGKPLEIRLSFD
jgi:C-terminal processing protease CtpA/Prc